MTRITKRIVGVAALLALAIAAVAAADHPSRLAANAAAPKHRRPKHR